MINGRLPAEQNILWILIYQICKFVTYHHQRAWAANAPTAAAPEMIARAQMAIPTRADALRLESLTKVAAQANHEIT